ncbi:hypothetical protein ElyMa_000985800 [Elysia marginata]|uniref:Uncharacterized protein n=1 Tax=Elysia marginata TaxID=1093978 RepID=A0AAV4HG90_9GAST|nr:hypothetical protein ElyMa_000985800 [Elysia marginata]
MDRYLDVVSELACLNDPESYAGGSFMLVVGPPKPDRSKDREQKMSGMLDATRLCGRQKKSVRGGLAAV